MTTLPFIDAHNHLHDARLEPFHERIWDALGRLPLRRCVVNGTCEEDWPAVLGLAEQRPEVIPSLGLHPWHVAKRGSCWKSQLEKGLDAGKAAVGEIGLDRWIEGHDLEDQSRVFQSQMEIAVHRNRPASIHCLKAWGRLHDLLREGPRPATGFLLHSYGGPIEMVEPLAALGAYFSLSGYFAHPRKERQRAVFREIPRARLLIETDAPDMVPPLSHRRFELRIGEGLELNHPANLLENYRFAAELVGLPLAELARQVEENFGRLFAPVLRG